MTDLSKPISSLQAGHWFKLICGASFQHLPAVRNLALVYTLAGADCIDVAADPAVIAAAQAGLQVAHDLMIAAQARGFGYSQALPLLMVSLNDGEDPHFRKAEFNPEVCPPQCPRPCEKICPAQAIVFGNISGVVQDRCYGCGRCLPVCPSELIYTRAYVSTPGAIAPLVLSTGVDAVEIHTQVGRLSEFGRLWQGVKPWIERLQLVAISCPDGEGMIEYLWSLYNLIAPLPCPLIWQTDGRPMSGDIGDGTTLAAVKLGEKVLAAGLPGYVQLAGGTNSYTVQKLKATGLMKIREQGSKVESLPSNKVKVQKVLEQSEASKVTTQDLPINTAPRKQQEACGGFANPQSPTTPDCDHRVSRPRNHRLPNTFISGIAYGSYARVLLSPILEQLEQISMDTTEIPIRLEENQELLWQAVALADALVSQLKSEQ